MPNEQESKNDSNKPVLLVAAAFLVFIVLVFLVGRAVMKNHSPKVKENVLPRTGMTILMRPL